MAGDWIKMRVDLAGDPAVIAIANCVKLDEDTVVGKLHRLWAWADRHLISSDAVGVTQTWLDRHVHCEGFAQALIDSGWLEVIDSGLRFPNFDRHNLETGKQRSLTANRNAKLRRKKSAERDAPSVTKSAPTEEKRRVLEEAKASSCSEPPQAEASEPSGIVFPIKGKRRNWALPAAKLAEYVESFNGLDVPAEFRRARQWLRDHPTKQKTATGMPSFLTRWLSRSNDRATPMSHGTPAVMSVPEMRERGLLP